MVNDQASRAFGTALLLLAVLAPLLLPVYAFEVAPESGQRALIVLHGCEAIVAALAATMALRVAYLRGVRYALRALGNTAPALDALRLG